MMLGDNEEPSQSECRRVSSIYNGVEDVEPGEGETLKWRLSSNVR